MSVSAELKYTKTHEWMRTLENGNVQVGITDYAQDQLGDLVYINLPEPGDDVTAGETFGDVESVKAVSDLFSPVTGIVEAVNEELQDEPEKMNNAPYEAWIMEVSGVTGTEDLMSAEEYEQFCQAQ